MRHRTFAGSATFLLVFAAGSREVAAQDGPVQVDVRVTVTAAAGKDVFLDQGRVAGLEPGDEVTLHPQGGGSVIARVRTVSRSNCRAEILGTLRPISPGTPGVVRIPKSRLQSSETPAQTTTKTRIVPAHPPWEQPFGKGDGDKPLLAPVSGRTPSERPLTLRGRTWLNFTNSWSRQNNASSGSFNQQYTLGSAGTDVMASNPFGAGGEFHFRGDLNHRRADLDGAPNESTTRARLDRLSYRYGHADDSPRRVQVGRFLQTMFPELGLVDGVEADAKLSSTQRVGFSFGGFPEPFTTQATGDDLQSALFWRFTTGKDDSFDIGAAYQKTWHRGSPDRDLLLLNTSFRPADELRIYSSVWIDFYDGNEQVQNSGVEVTEALLNGSYSFSRGSGLGLTVSHVRWPDLKRNEYDPIVITRILDNRVFRTTLNSWHELREDVRASTLLSYWEDQVGDGTNADVGISYRDLICESSSFDLHVFRNESAYNDSYGLRCTYSQYSGVWSYRVGYEIARFKNDSQTVAAHAFDNQQAIVAGLQASLTNSTDFSINFDYRFGADQDATTLGAYFQTRY